MRKKIAQELLDQTPQEVRERVREYGNLLVEICQEKFFNAEEPLIKNPVDYFYNEKGDYTITLFDEPIAIAKREEDAIYLKNVYARLTLRIDVLKAMVNNNVS